MHSAARLANSWQRLGHAKPAELKDARLQLHWAAQVVAAVGKTHLEARKDDSHPSLGWMPERGVFAGHLVPGPTPFQAALRPADMLLLLLDENSRAFAHFELDGHTLDEAHAWMSGAILQASQGAVDRPLTPAGYELPPHPVGEGEPFAVAERGLFAEMGRWFHDAALVLEILAERSPGASDVRGWPHHFDIASLIVLAGEGESMRSIGLGMSPGDQNFDEPYFYVTPWPYPEPKGLPDLPSGAQWHTEGWVGALLPAAAIDLDAPAPSQAESVVHFMEFARDAARALLLD